MDNIINSITSDTLYLTIAIILGVVVVISVIKKLIKMVLLSVLLIVLYIGYLAYNGEKIPISRKEVVDHISEKIEAGKRAGSSIINKNMMEKLKNR